MLPEPRFVLGLLALQSLTATLSWLWLAGFRDAHGARHVQAFTLLQAFGWLLLATSPPSAGGTVTAWLLLGVGCLSMSLTLLVMAIQHWSGSGDRRLPGLSAALALASPALLARDPTPASLPAMLPLALQLTLLLGLLISSGLKSARFQPWRGLLISALTVLMLALGAMAFDSDGADPMKMTIGLIGLAVALQLSHHAAFGAWKEVAESAQAALIQTHPQSGLPTEAALDARINEAISVARRYREPLVLVLLSLESEDRTNESTTRPNELPLARHLTKAARTGDYVAHLHGANFAVLMPRSLPDGPLALDSRLKASLQTQQAGVEPPVYSGGWAQLHRGDRHAADLKRRALAALHEARRHGRGNFQGEPGTSG